jgi:hypothetical protein
MCSTLWDDFEARGAALTVLVLVPGMAAGAKVHPRRQQAGIEAANAKGIYKGRKASEPVEKVREMHTCGYGPTAIAKALGISRMSVHRALTRREAQAHLPQFVSKKGPCALLPNAIVSDPDQQRRNKHRRQRDLLAAGPPSAVRGRQVRRLA